MSERAQAFAVGLGAALAVGLPAVLLAQLLDALRDGDLPGTVTVPLSIVVLAGALLGGEAVGRRRPGRHRGVAALVGLVALGLVVGLGTLRRIVAGDDVTPLAALAAMVWGPALGLLGGALGARRAGRTRP